MAVEQEGCQFYVMLSLFPMISHDLRYQDENTRLMTTRLLMKIKANKAYPDCIIYLMWYLLIHCAIGRMIPRRFDLFAACYLRNRTTFSVDGQQEWCRWLCNISAVTSVGKWPILGILQLKDVHSIRQSMIFLEEPFRRHAVNDEVLVDPILVEYAFDAWWY